MVAQEVNGKRGMWCLVKKRTLVEGLELTQRSLGLFNDDATQGSKLKLHNVEIPETKSVSVLK